MAQLRSGDLRHQVTLRQPTKSRDGKGGYEIGFADVATVWAEVIALDGRESVMERVLEGVSTYRVRIRYRTDVGAEWQLRYGAIELNITAPPADPDGRREQLVIIASSQAALKPSV